MYIEIKDYTKVIKGARVLDDINAAFDRGHIYGIRGRNGSGKTMLLRAICGLIFPDKGSVSIDGMVIGKDRDFPESCGVLIGYPEFIPYLTAYENLKQLNRIRKLSSDERIREVLEEVGLDSNSSKIFHSFSMGMKQKLGIAAALMDHPALIILDEPTNALDQESIDRLHDILLKEKEGGACILVSSHDREELSELSDHIISMDSGRIVE
ncbi:MAG: ATP-binding cassette domain-containing protein [Lachnospiraceae bacterium]|nr:ATP-binding cassette domain-containing protein [Lachnospiraceae bacterium]